MNRALREQTLRACFHVALGREPADLLFVPETITQTAGAKRALDEAPLGEAATALYAHLTGDWGDLDDEDKQTNDWALRTGGRILASYKLSTGIQFWIITDAGHDVTTFLLPEEY